jgi:hypothetical protein
MRPRRSASALTRDLSEIMQDFEGEIGARMAGRVQ